MYEYVATAKGTMTKPFRNVQVGEVVLSKEPIKASWLVLKKDAPKKPVELPIMTGMKVHARGRDALAPQNKADVYVDPNYDTAVKAIKKLEDLQDGKAAQPIPPATTPAEPVGQPAPSVQGSGNQDVLG